MNILLVIALSIVIGVLSLLILTFIYFYLKLHSRFEALYKQNVFLKLHYSEKGLEKLNVAREKSAKIIGDAITHAEEIIQKAELINNDANKDLTNQLTQLSKQQKEILKKQLDELQLNFHDAITHLTEEDINIFQNISKDLESAAILEVQKFEKQLHDQTIGGQNIVEQRIQDAFTKANFEINEYKKDRLAKADKDVAFLIQKISKELLQKTLNTEDHKLLIKAALEEAKTEMTDF